MTDVSLLPDFRYRWRWTLPATPEELWPLVSDTNRFNRDTGLPPVEDMREPGQELANGRRHLRFSSMGLTVEWQEQPFEWIRPRRFGVVRRYSRGPLEEMRVRVDLEPREKGRTLLTYGVTAKPSGLPGLLAIPLGIGLVSRIRFGRTFRRYAWQAGDGSSVAAPKKERVGLRHMKKASTRQRLTAHGVDPDLAELLLSYVLGVDDLSTARLRPYALADIWGTPRKETLVAFLRATRAGVLELQWSLLCPLCRGSKDEVGRLRELRTSGVHCDTCRIDFAAEMDRSVELSFSPHPSVREVSAPAFCVAGPQITPHIVVQQLLGAGESRSLQPLLEPGRYRVRTLSGSHSSPFVAVSPGGEARALLEVDPDGWRVPGKEVLSTRPELVIRNRLDEERLVVLERAAWADDTVTGAEVTALPEFRDLFSGEVLAAGEFMSVGTLTVAFTDLRGSTALYRSVGDAPAFGKVMEHFEVLDAAIEAHGGTMVKTIGDAVMATFPEPGGAVRAVARAQEELADAEGLVLKAGVHVGTCFIVTMNERLDYFGTTVNVAARLQDLSRGGDVVFSERVREALVEDGALAELPELEVVELGPGDLKGIEDGVFRPWRITLAPREAG